jgi:hypothetical protein
VTILPAATTTRAPPQASRRRNGETPEQRELVDEYENFKSDTLCNGANVRQALYTLQADLLVCRNAGLDWPTMKYWCEGTHSTVRLASGDAIRPNPDYLEE